MNDRVKELERLLEELHPYVRGCSAELWDRYHAALSQQAEPECVACEGYPAACNNPCALCGKQAEPALAQDEQEVEPELKGLLRHLYTRPAQTEQKPCSDTLIKGAKALLALDEKGPLAPHGIGGLAREVIEKLIDRVEHAAQPEQQPIAHVSEETFCSDGTSDIITCNLPIGMALYAAPIAQTEQQPEQSEPNRRTLQWVVDRWHAEVANRPLVNIHRRILDSTWRQMIRHLGEDDVVLLGPRHDDMLDASGNPLPQYTAPIAQTAEDRMREAWRVAVERADAARAAQGDAGDK